MNSLRGFQFVRLVCFVLCFTLFWLQVGPVLAGEEAYERAEAAAKPRPELPKILLNKAINRSKGAKARSVADVKLLSWNQMGKIRGRGCLRNPYFDGSLPWQRSYQDVNLCNGNLFKSYTDIQVAQAQGAGLALQRTYNSNDATIGPFGTGWTHAYDIQMQEASDVAAQSGNSTASDGVNEVPRTDFFGGKHSYHRDADGLYTPPAYLYDELSSGYGAFLLNGPTQVLNDTDVGQDGTIKHYKNEVTLANGQSGNDRMCDYIQDRYGNRTVLSYGQTVTQADGSTRNLLTGVTDPVGRGLAFTWSNEGTTSQPAWRITQVQGPLVNGQAVAGTTYIVKYDYYTDTSNPSACYNLKDVVLDYGGLNRTTTYTYTSYTGTNANGTSTETGLIASITDPIGHVTSYTWGITPVGGGTVDLSPITTPLGTVYVTSVTSPGSGAALTYLFLFDVSSDWVPLPEGAPEGIVCEIWNSNSAEDSYEGRPMFAITADSSLRLTANYPESMENPPLWGEDEKAYDANNNLIEDFGDLTVDKVYTYGQVGNQLTQSFNGYSGQDTTTYYNASQYFQKQSDSEMDGHTTAYGYGTDTAGSTGDPDTNTGDRGQVLWVEDAGYNDPSSPSYGKKYFTSYNQYGQKLTGINLNGVVTQNTYGTSNNAPDGYYDLGNLVQVVQDPGTGHLNRTTSMHYDASGRVIQSTDPMGQVTSFTYNVLGQPLTVVTPARGSCPAETVSYNYEADGRTHSVTDNRGTTVITYEDEHYSNYTNYGGRVYSVSDPITGTISYTYLNSGEKLSETLPSGTVWNYIYINEPGSATNGVEWYTFYVLPKDDPNSLTHWLLSIKDNQGRTVNFVHDSFGAMGYAQYNIVNNSQGATVALDSTDDMYDSGYFANGLEYQWDQSTSTTSRGNLASRVTSAFQFNSVLGETVGSVLCSNSYTYDNANNRISNTVSVATTSGSGALQYSGGAASYGSLTPDQRFDEWFVKDGPQYQPFNGGPDTNYFNSQYCPATNQLSTSRTENYTYDDLNRLSMVSYGDGESQTYSFDSMGNRLGRTDTITPQSGSPTTSTTAYTYDAANRLTGVSQNGGTATAVTSDADGNTLSDSSGRTYTWDSQNRMASCTYQGQTTTFTYGSDGLRRSMTVGGVTTDYAYDGSMLVQEFQINQQTGQLTPSVTYMIGPMGPCCRINEQNQSEGYYPAGVTSTTPLTRGVTRWYVYDGLGSAIAELDDNNNMTTSRQYDVYGAPRQGTQQGVSATSSQGYVGSLGHITDQSTGGLIYMQARYYDPAMGRFVSEDPGQNGNNWFNYVGSNPVNDADPTGRAGEPDDELFKDILSELAELADRPYAPLQIWIATAFANFADKLYVKLMGESEFVTAMKTDTPEELSIDEDIVSVIVDEQAGAAEAEAAAGLGTEIVETSDEVGE